MSNPKPHPIDIEPSLAVKSRSVVTALGLMMLCGLCAALFLVSWLMAGELPWRAALMTGLFVLVLFLLRLIEPAARRFERRRKGEVLERP